MSTKVVTVKEVVPLTVGQKITLSDLQFSSSDNAGNMFVANCSVDQESTRTGYEIKPGCWRVTPEHGLMPIDFVKSTRYIETGTSEKIKRHMHAFLNNLSVYKKYNQPPKRSILLHGDPGTGKTACIRNFINENFVGQERVCVLYIDSQGVSWETITQMFMESDVSSVDLVFFVVEDIGGTELEERGNSISSTLLNFLDGNRSVFRVPTLLVSTTNFLGRLGKALKRPGRFDVLLAVDAPAFEEFCVLVEGVLDRSLTEDERDAFKGSGFTPAFGIEAVIRAEIMGESIAQVVRQLKEQRTTAEGAAEGVMGFGGDEDDDL